MQEFSEARALIHAKAISDDLGPHPPSHSALQRGSLYLAAQLNQLAASPHARDDVTTMWAAHRASGGADVNLFAFDLATTYDNVTNLYFTISPTDPEKAARPALLLNSHYDSAIGVPGAADCAACVAVLLEAARAILHNPGYPIEVPLVILLNAAEESFVTVGTGDG